MESLLDSIEAWVIRYHQQLSEEEPKAKEAMVLPPPPDLTLPEELANIPTLERIQLADSPGKGRGWFARQHLAAGTLLMVAKPIAMVMDYEDDDDVEEVEVEGRMEEDDDEDGGNEKEEREPKINELLLMRVLQRLQHEPELWPNVLSTLYPREEDIQAKALPAWVCADDAVFCQVEALLQQLSQQPPAAAPSEATSSPAKAAAPLPVKDISRRLPLIIRYNVMSVETCPEMLSHAASGYAALSAIGLYHWPSFFNHSARPNVSRWAVGDVMALVTNQPVEAGQELTISYLEHDVLCESPYRRNLMLRMDFDEQGGGDHIVESADQDGPDLPVVDTEVQNELMGMDAFARLTAIDDLMQQACGAKLPDGDEPPEDPQDISPAGEGDEHPRPPGSSFERVNPQEENYVDKMEAGGTPWFQCDVQNLRILKAITLEGLGQAREALRLWEECLAFVEEKLPPNDESSVVLHVQAALTAWQLGEAERARHFAARAVEIHQILFGGDVAWFRRRLKRDLELPLRPAQDPSTADVLWPPLS